LIRRARYLLVAAGSAAILAGSMTLAGAGAASAYTLPSCLVTGYHCTTSVAAPGSLFQNGGAAGYYGADDNHTHYRFVQTIVNASPQLIDLNGPLGSELYPATTGVELCDPNSGVALKLALGFFNGSYQVAYLVGKFPTHGPAATADPCIQSNFQTSGSIFRFGTLMGLTGIPQNSNVYLGIYYDPTPGAHFHQISFGACDDATGACRQAYTHSRFSLNLFEFGIGTFTPANVLTAGAVNYFQTFSSSEVTCYSCAGMVPISTVQSVGPFGAGGLYEAQFANSSSQVVMSPNDTLSGTTFKMYNGSTSI
jgi:hypothetical protein